MARRKRKPIDVLPFNTDADGRCSRTIKANYSNMHAANFLYHDKDGFCATCVIEIYGDKRHERKDENT